MNRPAYWAINQIVIDGKVQKRLMMVLRTSPCARIEKRKRCFICGFDYHGCGLKDCDIVAQFEYSKQTIYENNVEHIDFLSFGSILDERQIDFSQVLRVIKEAKEIKSINSILFEGRVEHCCFDKLNAAKKILNDIKLEYGIGLECHSDYVRNDILEKDLRFKDYINCVRSLTAMDIGVCTYIVVGIPKLSLKDSFKETRDSILAVANLYRRLNCKGRIALYPIFIAPNSQLERLYNCGQYKLISLDDVVKILQDIDGKIDLKKTPIFIGLDDEGISDNRYVGFYDSELSSLINKFNSTQDLSLFKPRR